MAFIRRLIAFAVLLHCSIALVEFTKSKLYDENDFARTVSIPNFCDVGCRIYASVPAASADIAKQIMVHDNSQADKSLYDISKLADGSVKGFFKVEAGNAQIDIMNSNIGLATAPVAVWVVRNDAANSNEGKVYDATALPPAGTPLGVVTVMSAEPFTIRSKSDGEMLMTSTLSGYDAIRVGDNPDSGDNCIIVIDQTADENAFEDIQVSVRSPMITFNFDDFTYYNTMLGLSAAIETATSLDFYLAQSATSISFAASPGFMCKGGKTYRSSLYDENTKYRYSSSDLAYDVAITSVLTTDDAHPVTIRDIANNNEYILSAASPEFVKDFTVQQTSNLAIYWTRNAADLDQSFLVRVMPSNAQAIPQVTTQEATTAAEPELRTTTELVPEPERTTTTESVPEAPHTTTAGDSEQRTTTQKAVDDHTDGSTTSAQPVVPDHPDVSFTTSEPDHSVDPDHTQPEAPKTSRRTTPQKSTMTTPSHPKDVTSTTMRPPSTSPTKPFTTSGAATYGSTLVALTVGYALLV